MLIEKYRLKIEEGLASFILSMGEKNELRDACEFALLNGGKRLRPILVCMVADALGNRFEVLPSALSVEFFHTASLIADDLPCMDDDDFRRSRPSLHKAYGESVAILASYALIAEGYGGVYRNSLLNPSANAMLCIEAARRCAGINGATNGQFLDLFPPDSTLETIQKIIYQKTVTLFEISFIFGWIFGGGNETRLSEVYQVAYHFGMAFQIGDDLQDFDQDIKQESLVNLAVILGKDKAISYFETQVFELEMSLKKLGLWNDSFEEIVIFLKNYGMNGITPGR